MQELGVALELAGAEGRAPPMPRVARGSSGQRMPEKPMPHVARGMSFPPALPDLQVPVLNQGWLERGHGSHLGEVWQSRRRT